jgi:poly(3-hydroxybutyrate) depolymerase
METITLPKRNKGFSKHLVSLMLIICTSLALGCSDDGGSDPIQEIPPPDANFSADNVSIGLGESVNFTDTSTGNPTSWQWTFEGGTPSSSTEKNPVVTYSSLGSFSVTLKATNSGGEDTEIKNAYITVACETCSAECPDICPVGTIYVDGVLRTYEVRLPAAYESNDNMPVIIDLHGTYSTIADHKTFSAFNDIADANNIIMVWPQALELTACDNEVYSSRWNANFVNLPNDIGFIDALIDRVITDYKVNPKRVYVDGLSNGGFMAYSLACALSDKIAAIASVAGTMSDNLMNTCNPNRTVPVLEIHGTADQICDYDGYNAGCEGHAAAVDDLIAFWQSKNGCSSSYDEISYDDLDTSDGCTARMLTYQGCNNTVKLVIIDGGGHFWPGSEAFADYYVNYYSVLGPWNFDIEANQVIWDFFKDKSLP